MRHGLISKTIIISDQLYLTYIFSHYLKINISTNIWKYNKTVIITWEQWLKGCLDLKYTTVYNIIAKNSH